MKYTLDKLLKKYVTPYPDLPLLNRRYHRVLYLPEKHKRSSCHWDISRKKENA